MSTKIYKINPVPPQLSHNAHPKVKTLYSSKEDISNLLSARRVGIVGTRKPSSYGRVITQKIASELAKAGVVIVSGLALGVDSIAHQAAVDANKPTIAVLPSSIDNIYPKTHDVLARRIIETGGVLLSEYPQYTPLHKSNFIARNRIIAVLSEIVIITEAAEKSGSLHTAQFALDQGIDVMAVPGAITNELSRGTNNLIKTGAGVITSAQDVLDALGIKPQEAKQQQLFDSTITPEGSIIIKALLKGMSEGDELLKLSGLAPDIFQQTITMLEIDGKVQSTGNNTWIIS